MLFNYTTCISDNATVLRTIFSVFHDDLLHKIKSGSGCDDWTAHAILFDVYIECTLYMEGFDGLEAARAWIFKRVEELCINYPGKETKQQQDTLHTFKDAYYTPKRANNLYKRRKSIPAGEGIETLDMGIGEELPDNLTGADLETLDIQLGEELPDDLNLETLYEITGEDKAIFKAAYLEGNRLFDVAREKGLQYMDALRSYALVSDYITFCLTGIKE